MNTEGKTVIYKSYDNLYSKSQRHREFYIRRFYAAAQPHSIGEKLGDEASYIRERHCLGRKYTQRDKKLNVLRKI